jgi:transposase InsO family protein
LDRGGEYTSNLVVNFCKKNDIKKELTTRYTLQQNGVVARKNRTIIEMSRSMMKEKGLPTKYWGEVIETTIYLINRCPTK